MLFLGEIRVNRLASGTIRACWTAIWQLRITGIVSWNWSILAGDLAGSRGNIKSRAPIIAKFLAPRDPDGVLGTMELDQEVAVD